MSVCPKAAFSRQKSAEIFRSQLTSKNCHFTYQRGVSPFPIYASVFFWFVGGYVRFRGYSWRPTPLYIHTYICTTCRVTHQWVVCPFSICASDFCFWRYTLFRRDSFTCHLHTMSRMSMHSTDSYVTGNSLICSSCSWVCVRVNLYHVTHVNALTTDSSQICDIQLINMWQVTHWYVLLVRECVCACQLVLTTHNRQLTDMWWLRIVGSIKSQVSFAEYCLFYRALLQKRHII